MRYRPFVVLVVCTLVVVFLPPGDDDGGTSGVGASEFADDAALGETGAAIETEGVTDTSVAGTGGVAGSTRTRTRTGTGSSTSGGAGASGGATTGGTGGTAVPGYPGMGTPEALANPACDPATGRIRFPSVYAAPCVKPWPKGASNGGNTATGVTGTTVKIVMYEPQSAQRNENEFRRDVNDTFDIYNKHFELWGRQVQIEFVIASGSDEAAQRADAIQIATQNRPFLVIPAVSNNTHDVLTAELAARGVIAWQGEVKWAEMQAQAPYRWSFFMDDRLKTLHAAEYVGKRLAGRNTRWAGDATLNGDPRVFGIVYPHTWDKDFLDSQAARFNLQFADALTYRRGDTVGAQERASTIVSRLKDKGVTTVVNGGDAIFNVVMSQQATTQGFSPEWVILGIGNSDAAVLSRLNDQQQWAHAFGFGIINVLPPPDKYEPAVLYRWHHGRPYPPNASSAGTVLSTWTMAQTIYPCFTLAGPVLTPQTFRDGCFAVPPTGGSYCPGAVGCISYHGVSFGPHLGVPWLDYSGDDDQADKWWDPNAVGSDEIGVTGPGLYRFMEMGKRRRTGAWPNEEPAAFDTRNTTLVNENPKPPDKPPDYAHAAH